MDDIYVGEETGDLKIDIHKTIIMPLLNEATAICCKEQDDIINFGLFVSEMYTNETSNHDKESLDKLVKQIDVNQKLDFQTNALI